VKPLLAWDDSEDIRDLIRTNLAVRRRLPAVRLRASQLFGLEAAYLGGRL